MTQNVLTLLSVHAYSSTDPRKRFFLSPLYGTSYSYTLSCILIMSSNTLENIDFTLCILAFLQSISHSYSMNLHLYMIFMNQSKQIIKSFRGVFEVRHGQPKQNRHGHIMVFNSRVQSIGFLIKWFFKF